MHKGYSVDRRGVYFVGHELQLSRADRLNRGLVDAQSQFTPAELEARFAEFFPDGLSEHGWHYATRQADWLQHGETGEHYLLYEPQIELVFELVRRAFFPNAHSRFESYFAWESVEAARAFRTSNQPIYVIEAEQVIRADQQWLRLGRTIGVGLENALRYWSGSATSNPRWELVMKAPVRVVEEVV